MHQKVPAWFGGKLRGKGPAHGRHLAAQLTLLGTSGLGQGDAFPLTFADQRAFELGERSHD